MSSTSAWQWNAQHQLYFNPSSQTWAAPQPNGEWVYSTPSESPSNSAVPSTDDAAPADEDDVDGLPIPEEQLWPGDDDDDEPIDPFAKTPLLRLRLLLLSSAILKPPASLALVDPSEGVSLGRDKTFEKRIRLPELEVSKSHATVFWMRPGVEDGMPEGGWAVVDNGSTHGTWVTREGSGRERLSEAKKASGARELRHGDTLTVGSTAFAVHIHPSLACEGCSVAADASNLIPLVSTSDAPPTPDTSADSFSTKTKAQKEQDRRAKMRRLKDKLLAPPSHGGGSIESRKAATKLAASTSATGSRVVPPSSSAAQWEPPKTVFIDRAAARRARTGAPSTASPVTANPFFAVPGRASASAAATTSAAPTAPPPSPFAATSRGAQLLSKLTRPAESTSAGGGGARLGTLIQARTFDTATTGREQRPGLGSKPLVVIGQQPSSGGGGGPPAPNGKRGWREDVREANRKRFRDLEAGS